MLLFVQEEVQSIDFDKIVKIGSGGFGIVYEDVSRKYAIKKVWESVFGIPSYFTDTVDSPLST